VLSVNLDNLIEDGSCNFVRTVANGSTSAATGLVSGDPLLAALTWDSGPTPTAALGAGSPAFGAGDPSFCASAPVNGLDQIGDTRPTACAIGAWDGTISSNTTPPTTSSPDDATSHMGYCSAPGDFDPYSGLPFPPGTFLVVAAGQPASDPSYTGATPALYLQGLGIACGAPAGYTATGQTVGYGGAGDPGAYPYYVQT